MKKTKRQLRAEAAGRLNAMTEDPTMGSVAVAALGKPVNGWEWRDALIDLLQDDEPPEGDAADDGVKRSMTNLEWLYESNPAFRANVNQQAAPHSSCEFSPCHWGEDVGEWLMAEHAEVVLNAEEYDLGPESGAESRTEKAGRDNMSRPKEAPAACCLE